MKQFDITYFYGPTDEFTVKDEVIADMAACGFTLAQTWFHEPEVTKKALELMKKYGLRASVTDKRLKKLCQENELDKVDEVVKQVVDDFAEFDNVVEWDIYDEPTNALFPVLKKIVEAFRRYAPHTQTVINLFPNYAQPHQLGDIDYNSHLDHFIEQVDPDFLSYDNYHFVGRESRNKYNLNSAVNEREMLIRLAAEQTEDRKELFFENIELIRKKGLENGLRQMLIVLLSEHGSYRNLTRAELLWEVNMCLVYGFGRISYFTYWRPEEDDFWHYDNAICDRDGSKMQHYYDVQANNKKIYPIGCHLFNTRSSAVFHVGTPESGTTAFTGFDAIKEIEGENAVIGFFEDGSVYLVNRDYQKSNTLTLHSEKPMTVFDNGEFVAGGCDLTVTLEAGDGILFKIDQ